MDGCVRVEAGDISYQSTKVDLFVDYKARFKTEVQTLAKFKHSSIVRITGVLKENTILIGTSLPRAIWFCKIVITILIAYLLM